MCYVMCVHSVHHSCSHAHVQILRRHMPGGWFGEDRDGHPVWYDHLDLDCRGKEGKVEMGWR